MIAYVFPGQGSQFVGMGRDLYQSSSRARQVFDQADEALGFPISRLCFEGPEEILRETVHAQPAILTVSIACLRATTQLNGTPRPSFVAGHSLGEYTALVYASVLDFSSAVRLVRERGRLMQEAGAIRPGSMAAIIGLDETSVNEICVQTGAQIANINCSGQVVISGTREAVARCMDLARSQGAAGVVPLQVSGAFHSDLMEPAVEGMANAISRVDFRAPEVPIVANSTATPVTTVEQIKQELLDQLCRCVRWQPSVEYMVNAGVSTFFEIGPGVVLTKLIKRIARKAQALNIGELVSVRTMNSDLPG
ncbi:MAG: ACP S-malonyltransferase [Dehalococcoidia bacterium]|nr:ACP S-malonyltransferase [Dehalococcoidia bacterium]